MRDGFEGKLTNAQWYTIGKCYVATVLRDITDLLADPVKVGIGLHGTESMFHLFVDSS